VSVNPRLLLQLSIILLTLSAAPTRADEKPAFAFKDGDRVAWIGSSSTRIGVWPKTVEFLLRTRHPDTRLEFKSFTTGGGTFATGLQNLEKGLADYKPTVVVFNYGGNDAGAGEKGLPTFKENMTKAYDRVKASGARVVFTTHQAGDVRKAGEAALARRKLYAETMLGFGKEKGWTVIDVHHPLEDLQRNGQKDDEAYTILKDTIHLTNPAYVAWGYYLYEGLNPPSAVSHAALSADGKVTKAVGCKVEDVKAEANGLSFTRADAVLPILPPEALPPRKPVPVEKHSAYLLTATGLPDGDYEVRCEGKPIGTVDAKALAAGVNLNTLLLDAKRPAPWEALAKDLWAAKATEQVGKTRWRFEVRKAPPE
jgi:lysophospholipase L1-like esterase